jgi:hypothetical protein
VCHDEEGGGVYIRKRPGGGESALPSLEEGRDIHVPRYGWSKYWVFPRFALIWQAIKRHTEFDMHRSIQIFDKILESGWIYWNRNLLKEFLKSGDVTRQVYLSKETH